MFHRPQGASKLVHSKKARKECCQENTNLQRSTAKIDRLSVRIFALFVSLWKKDVRKIAVQNTVPEIGSLASRGWQVGHEVESRAMPGPVHAEVAAIQGEH